MPADWLVLRLKEKLTRPCQVCGETFVARGSLALYCGKSCRDKAWRDRRPHATTRTRPQKGRTP
jgi:hypothetical protein